MVTPLPAASGIWHRADHDPVYRTFSRTHDDTTIDLDQGSRGLRGRHRSWIFWNSVSTQPGRSRAVRGAPPSRRSPTRHLSVAESGDRWGVTVPECGLGLDHLPGDPELKVLEVLFSFFS